MGMQKAVLASLAEINVAGWFEEDNTLSILTTDLRSTDPLLLQDKMNEELIGCHFERLNGSTPFETRFELCRDSEIDGEQSFKYARFD